MNHNAKKVRAFSLLGKKKLNIIRVALGTGQENWSVKNYSRSGNSEGILFCLRQNKDRSFSGMENRSLLSMKVCKHPLSKKFPQEI